nr:hypothetical protein Iba_chr07aCG6030 [Ipomoea batatas]
MVGNFEKRDYDEVSWLNIGEGVEVRDAYVVVGLEEEVRNIGYRGVFIGKNHSGGGILRTWSNGFVGTPKGFGSRSMRIAAAQHRTTRLQLSPSPQHHKPTAVCLQIPDQAPSGSKSSLSSVARRFVLDKYDLQLPTINSQKPTPRPPRSRLELNPSQHKHIEFNVGRLLFDPFHNPIIHKRSSSSECSLGGGLAPLILKERRHTGLSKLLRVVVNRGLNVIVVDSHLLVRVPSRELEVPIPRQKVIREVEAGKRQRIRADLGEAGTEDEPDDEDNRAGDDEAGDEYGEHASEEGGALHGVSIGLLVVRVIVVVVIIVIGSGRRSGIRIGSAGGGWGITVLISRSGGVAGDGLWPSLIAHCRGRGEYRAGEDLRLDWGKWVF